MGSSRSWDGTHEDSKEANRDIKDLILDTMSGNEIGKATDDGGLIKSYGDGGYELFGPSSSDKGHYHIGEDSKGNRYGHG